MKRFALAALALLLAPAGAQAAISVIGEPAAHDCYQAAVEGRTDQGAMASCNSALAGEMFSRRDEAATFVNRGVVRLHRREWAEALSDFDRAIRLMPALGEAHVDRGAALIMLRDYPAAIEAITLGLTYNTQDPHEAYFNRALANELRGDIRAAYMDYRRAAELAPEWPRPQLELARFQVRPAAVN